MSANACKVNSIFRIIAAENSEHCESVCCVCSWKICAKIYCSSYFLVSLYAFLGYSFIHTRSHVRTYVSTHTHTHFIFFFYVIDIDSILPWDLRRISHIIHMLLHLWTNGNRLILSINISSYFLIFEAHSIFVVVASNGKCEKAIKRGYIGCIDFTVLHINHRHKLKYLFGTSQHLAMPCHALPCLHTQIHIIYIQTKIRPRRRIVRNGTTFNGSTLFGLHPSFREPKNQRIWRRKKRRKIRQFFFSNSNEQILINQAHYVSFALLTMPLFTSFNHIQ